MYDKLALLNNPFTSIFLLLRNDTYKALRDIETLLHRGTKLLNEIEPFTFSPDQPPRVPIQIIPLKGNPPSTQRHDDRALRAKRLYKKQKSRDISSKHKQKIKIKIKL